MALSSFQLFLSQAQNAPGELKVQVLRVIMDLLIMYDQEFFGRSEDTVSLFFTLKGRKAGRLTEYPGNPNSRFFASGFGSRRNARSSSCYCYRTLQTSSGGYDYGASSAFFPDTVIRYA